MVCWSVGGEVGVMLVVKVWGREGEGERGREMRSTATTLLSSPKNRFFPARGYPLTWVHPHGVIGPQRTPPKSTWVH